MSTLKTLKALEAPANFPSTPFTMHVNLQDNLLRRRRRRFFLGFFSFLFLNWLLSLLYFLFISFLSIFFRYLLFRFLLVCRFLLFLLNKSTNRIKPSKDVSKLKDDEECLKIITSPIDKSLFVCL